MCGIVLSDLRCWTKSEIDFVNGWITGWCRIPIRINRMMNETGIWTDVQKMKWTDVQKKLLRTRVPQRSMPWTVVWQRYKLIQGNYHWLYTHHYSPWRMWSIHWILWTWMRIIYEVFDDLNFIHIEYCSKHFFYLFYFDRALGMATIRRYAYQYWSEDRYFNRDTYWSCSCMSIFVIEDSYRSKDFIYRWSIWYKSWLLDKE
jgi:hypothetical protein